MADLSSQAQIELQLLVTNYQKSKAEVQDFISTTTGATKAAAALGYAEEKRAKSTDAAAKTTRNATQSINAQRYALYDVSNALGIGGVALTGFAALSYKTAIDYQANFANVARTTQVTGLAAKVLETNLIGLSQVLPVSYEAITNIAAMGGQLGIATSKIPAFTKNVAQFSATTDVTTDAAATAFGRLNALLPDVQDNYQGLGSSILKVGINSVATESQIVSISGRLAGIGHTAGLSSDEVIGLSGALASIGVAPELAQGTITRLFTKIQTAVATGSSKLQDFGRVSGMTASEFQKAWQSDASGTLVRLLDGINASGDSAIGTIQGLGLSAARDIPTLLKLSQNTDILRNSLADAATGFQDGTQLGDSFGIKAETVAAKLTTLTNNFKALLAAIGDSSTGIGGLIDGANGLLQWATEVAKSPAGSVIAAWVIGLIGLTGVAALAGAGMLRLAATVLAVQTANGGAALSTGVFSTALGILRTGALGASAAETGLAATSGIVTTQMFGQAAATTSASAASTLLAVSMKTLGVAALVLIGAQVAGHLHDWAFEAMGLTTSADAAAAAVQRLNKAKITSDLGLDAPGLNSGKGDLGAAFAVNTQTRYGSLAGRASNGGVAAGQDFNSSIGNFTGLANISNNIKKYDEALAALVSSGNSKQAADDFKFISDKAVDQSAKLKDVQGQFPLYSAAVKESGDAAKGTVSDFEAQTQAVKDSLSAISDAIDGSLKQENALYSLGSALGESGNDFSVYSQAGRQNLAALESVVSAVASQTEGDAQATANNLQGLFNALTQGAQIPAAALSFLSESIASLGVKKISPTAFNLSSLFQGVDAGTKKVQKLGGAAGGAAKQVRTLVDYGNDLSTVFKRAFEIRFSGQSALDDISSGWSKIRQQAEDAAKAMADANATLLQLASDKSINEYWLRVANAYGDTLRASQIQADLAKNAQDTAAAQKDLSKAQDQSDKTLVGNSDAAIANRAEILGLVTNYQSYVQALASSGMSQADLAIKTAQLKQDFLAQATQLGFNSTELGTYSAAFDDVSKAIGRVPRNITVKANTDPAMQALNELEAKLQKIGGSSYSPTVNVTTNTSGLDAALSKQHASLWAQFLTLNNAPLGLANASRMADLKQTFQTLYGFKGWSGGGYTGDGSTSSVAGAVHGKEFVFSAPAVANLGVNNLAFLHNMAKSGGSFNMGGGGSSSGTPGVTQLSPYDRQLLADIRDAIARGLVIAPGALQGSVNGSNANSSNRRVV